VTLERSTATIFTLPLVDTTMAIFVRRPGRSVISIGNHVNEFDTPVWILVALTVLTLALADIATRLATKGHDHLPTTLTSSVASLARAVASKGGGDWPPKRGHAHRMLALTAGVFGVFVFANYCSFLNGYLTVLIPALTVKNVEDIYYNTAGLTQWSGSFVVAAMADNPEGSVKRKIYQKFQSDPQAPVRSALQGLANVAERNYALIDARLTGLLALRGSEYECDVMDVPNFSYATTSIALAFAKNLSSLAEAFDRHILDMKQNGVLDQIILRYVKPSTVTQEQCGSGVAPLGRSNLFVPIFILAVGVAAALVFALAERLTSSVYPPKFTPQASSTQVKISLATNVLASRSLEPDQKLDLLQQLLEVSK